MKVAGLVDGESYASIVQPSDTEVLESGLTAVSWLAVREDVSAGQIRLLTFNCKPFITVDLLLHRLLETGLEFLNLSI